MADDINNPIADLRVIALYPGRITSLATRRGVRFRTRKKAASTLVPCRLDALDGRTVAVPEFMVPAGTPNPTFRVQFETTRVLGDQRCAVCVVLSGERGEWKLDPEQTLLAPIFDDGNRMIFEFRRAHIVKVEKRGELETRLVAIDPIRGVLGTKTVHRFDTRMLSLATRCVEHLAGALDLFPMRELPLARQQSRVPEGEANLSFASRMRGKLQSRAMGHASDVSIQDCLNADCTAECKTESS